MWNWKQWTIFGLVGTLCTTAGHLLADGIEVLAAAHTLKKAAKKAEAESAAKLAKPAKPAQ